MGRSNKALGVALIEVLVSVVLIGVGLVTIVRALDICVRTTRRVRDVQQAERLLDEVLLDAAWLDPPAAGTRLSGRFDAPHGRFHWDVKTETVGNTPFLSVRATVRWGDSRRARRVTGERVMLP